jgi:hypothetical protein
MAEPADVLLDDLWADYLAITPLAGRVHALLAARGETIFNDHIALRTFAAPGLGLDAIARPFERLGWEPRDRYRFDDKHLNARYWQHADPARPKIFISELCLDELPASARALLDGLIAQLPAGFGEQATLALAGRPWRVSHDTYGALLATSEYAAWMAAFGFRVNHFTVDLGRLRTVASLAEMNALLTQSGFELNTAGGAIKGTPADRLEQSSTRAEEVDIPFDDVTVRIPSCYYEFAKRYPLPDGTLFQGFVPASADRLFESTDVLVSAT